MTRTLAENIVRGRQAIALAKGRGIDTTDWEHPEIVTWRQSPNYQFSGNLSYRCEYYNSTDRTVKTGDSAETDEMCMAVGYFYPGARSVLCINSFVVPF